ncbi:MAG: hypothetical protein ACRCTZ_18295 [Sarcina sp.]
MKKEDKTGEINKNTQGSTMEIVRYKNKSDIDVIFKSGYISKNKMYKDFKSGNIKDYLYPSLLGHGIIGVGKYSKSNSQQYKIWSGVINRAFNKKYKSNKKTYNDVCVSGDFLNFQKFAEWFDDNNWVGEDAQIDKDILIKGNKIYSAGNCIIVDQRINCLFTKCNKSRGDLPIGCSIRKGRNKIFVSLSVHDGEKSRRVYLGTYDDKNDAFKAYKEFKENYIKDVADEYFKKYQKFPYKLLQAMYEYEVEIND